MEPVGPDVQANVAVFCPPFSQLQRLLARMRQCCGDARASLRCAHHPLGGSRRELDSEERARARVRARQGRGFLVR